MRLGTAAYHSAAAGAFLVRILGRDSRLVGCFPGADELWIDSRSNWWLRSVRLCNGSSKEAAELEREEEGEKDICTYIKRERERLPRLIPPDLLPVFTIDHTRHSSLSMD